jgi:hypothetical protein
MRRLETALFGGMAFLSGTAAVGTFLNDSSPPDAFYFGIFFAVSTLSFAAAALFHGVGIKKGSRVESPGLLH